MDTNRRFNDGIDVKTAISWLAIIVGIVALYVCLFTFALEFLAPIVAYGICTLGILAAMVVLLGASETL